MKQAFYIVIFLLSLSACRAPKQAQVKPRPEWVSNRPVSMDYYVGVGTATKTAGKLDYQQVAKKNALDDMVSEIKVTVSTSSVLRSVQRDLEFNQQFNSTTRVTALNTVENYEVVDSWESGQEFWIYYRLSKSEYEALRRRKMQVQVDRALDFMDRADKLDSRSNLVQKMQLKAAALACLQNYLNEDVMAMFQGKDVKLINTILNSIQNDMFGVKFKTASTMKGTVGKALAAFDVTAVRDEGGIVANLPLKAGSDGAPITSFDRIETDERGIATFTRARVQGVGSTQFLRISIDVERVIRTDSLNALLRTVLMNMQPPSASIKVATEPLKIFVESRELNLSKPMEQTFIGPAIRKDLTQNGCMLVSGAADADYAVYIKANTKAQGVMWGNMLGSAVEVSVSVTDTKTNIELYKETLPQVKGFQTTDENAGIDAYKKSLPELHKKLLPSLTRALFSGGN